MNRQFEDPDFTFRAVGTEALATCRHCGLEMKTAELAKISQSGNMEAISAQVKKLGDACGACHKPFRKPKEESYKNKS